MTKARKNPLEKMVNVGVRVPISTKQFLQEEAEAKGISEGTIARQYLMLGIEAAKRRGVSYNPVAAQLMEIMKNADAALQFDILALAQTLQLRRAQDQQYDELSKAADEGMIIEDVSIIGQG